MRLATQLKLLLAAATAGMLLPAPAAPSNPATVNVQVFSLFHPGELRIRPAGTQILRLITPSGEALLEGGSSASCRATATGVDCTLPGQRLHGPFIETSCEGPACEFLLAVPGKIERRFQGELRITAPPATQNAAATLNAIVRIAIETAVSSIVAAESPPDAAPSALEAQAVATRSYLLAGPRHRGFDFCDTTHCQFLREPPPAGSAAAQAARATQALVLTYRGRTIRALYSRSCGGQTRTLLDAGLNPAERYPFFSVRCELCSREPERWREPFIPSDLSALLDSPTEAARLQVARQAGWSRLPSSHFRAERSDGTIVLHGTGIGHGIGLCQRGAAALSAVDADFRAILRHYYPNTTLGAPPR